jgi:glycosyltransferase involved in cell wall biosynthesis
MRIFIYSYPSLQINPGGPTYKTAMLHHHLKEAGIEVYFFDMWDDSITYRQDDIFYIFTANISTWSLAMNLKARGLRYVVNPIFYSNHPPGLIRLYMTLEKPFRMAFRRSYSDYDLTADICRQADMVLPNTAAEARLLQKAFDLEPHKLKVIAKGVEKRFAAANGSLFFDKYQLQDFVLYTGHLGPVRKNGLNIIKAMKDSNADCVIIGDVLNNAEGKACLDLINNSENIHYLGWLAHDDPLLESAYAACHTFILPTRYETPGRAALEAGLAGANIVITPAGGTREYFADLALYPEPREVRSISNAISESLQRPGQTALRERIMKNYIWEKVALETLKVLKKLC